MVWLAGAAVLSGCGGDDLSGPVRTTPPVSYAAYDAQSAALHATWDPAGFTPPASLPLSGAAQFAGVMRLHLEGAAGDIPLNGATVLNVAFASNSLSGSASGFVGVSGDQYAGTLTVVNGTIDRAADPQNQYTFSANMSGTLSGAAGSFALTADMNGDFLGANHGAASGLVAGSLASAAGTGYLFGDFIAER